MLIEPLTLLKQIYVNLKPFLRVFLNTDFPGFPEYIN